MAFAQSCPGSRTIREPIPESVKCANCGSDVEIWSDELSAACGKCGTRAFKEQRPSCIDWCPAAKECIGIEAFKKMRPEIGEKSADGKETTALDLMEREHDHALRQLGLLRGATLCLRVSGKNDTSAQSPLIAKALDDLNKVFAFIDDEVRTHFRHEEEVLFPLLEKHLGQTNSPVETLLKEHVEFWQMFDELRKKTAEVASAGGERLPDLCADLYAVGGRISAFLQEHISGMAVVQLFNRQEREAEKFADLNSKHRDANIESIYYYSVFYPVIELVQSVGIALIVWYGGGQVVQGTLSIGALIAFFQYAQRFYEPISDLSEKYNILQSAMAASERIFKLIDTPVEIDDPAEPVELGELRDIEFRHVWFAYSGEQWVLRNVSFVVTKGERLALVGHTGAGKTTVTSLLLRFYEAQRGEILVNGVDIRKYRLADLRRMFAVVQQDVFLFSGTVAENVSLGDDSISRTEIEHSVRRVRAARFVEKLPEGYDAPVRERGAGFSVGEKQLLSFARALAYDPPVLVLDEATSSIDSETERLIQEAIEILMEGRTTVAIAHRLSTIRSADQILVFHHGEIRERGTHEELLRVDGIYRRLYELQYREERSDAASA